MSQVEIGVDTMTPELAAAAQEQITEVYSKYSFKNFRTQTMPIDIFKEDVSYLQRVYDNFYLLSLIFSFRFFCNLTQTRW